LKGLKSVTTTEFFTLFGPPEERTLSQVVLSRFQKKYSGTLTFLQFGLLTFGICYLHVWL